LNYFKYLPFIVRAQYPLPQVYEICLLKGKKCYY
jgi:hypothetical protein